MSKSLVKPVLVSGLLVTAMFSSILHADQLSNNTAEILSSPPPLPLPLPPIAEEYMPMGSPKSLQSAFKKMDKNNDERISFDEQISYQQAQKEKRKLEDFNRIIKECDKDNNGVISDKEFSAEQALFGMMPSEPKCMLPPFAHDIMDFDEDGILTTEEIKKAVMSDKPPTPKAKRKIENKLQQMEVKQKTKQFGKCDVNKDQLLSLREAFAVNCRITSTTEDYDAHDTNLDSYLSVEEIGKKVQSAIPEDDVPPEILKSMTPLERLEMRFFQCDKNSDERLDKDETRSKSCHVEPQLFSKADRNQDNAIEQSEMRRLRMQQSFDRNDKNHDGFLDKTEFKPEMIW